MIKMAGLVNVGLASSNNYIKIMTKLQNTLENHVKTS